MDKTYNIENPNVKLRFSIIVSVKGDNKKGDVSVFLSRNLKYDSGTMRFSR